MTWQPGLPVLTASDYAQWQAWCKARKLEQQRERRRKYPRIDYYPSKAAQAAIDTRAGCFAGGNYSAVIDALVLAGAGKFPE
ncbi:hypothetical protein [Rhodanobacter sp. MP7CTX1]|uniref:hypothetical protein n=1 Tax=Rhodanobacter sp. MP7CTX1 TaxID=2723084 RepID=UPI001618E725|nr:hypothetical protein [Rhodanobacter sp. MP7CTX1]MBB6186192.1 hypothetical protein [Rhodanobacter sp. MP7CTX1]